MAGLPPFFSIMAKKKIVLTEEQHLANKARLAEVVLDTKTEVKVGDKVYRIGALTYYAKWRISGLITELEVKDGNITTLIEAMSSNIPILAEILAIGILVKRNHIDRDAYEYTGELDRVKSALLDSVDDHSWGELLSTIFSKLDTGFFFGLTEMVKAINSMNDKAGYRKEIEKMKSKEDDGYLPIQSLVKSQA